MKKIYLLLLIGIVISMNLNAQTLEKKWGLGGAIGGYHNFGLEEGQFSYFMTDAYLSRYLSRSFDIMGHAYFGFGTGDEIFESLDMASTTLNLRYKFNNGYILPVRSLLQPYLYAGAGYMWDNKSNGVNYNFGAGVKYPLNQTLSIYAEGGYIAGIDGVRKNNEDIEINVKDNFAKLTVGIEASFLRQKDSDKDGVPDILDQCPETPKGAIVYIENPTRKQRKRIAEIESKYPSYTRPAEGCPYDTDGDGVYDGIDECPDTPAGVTVDEKGCPLDTDGDGVPDYRDKCPDTPKNVKVDENGCPFDADKDGVYDENDKCPDTPEGVAVDKNGCPLDSDGDGVVDSKDLCPDTPKKVKVDENGCPLDSDGDGVYDDDDKCPDTPKRFKVDKTGCPDYQVSVDFINSQIEPIFFATNVYTVTSNQNGKVDNLVNILNENPEYKINVYGYADPRGSAEYNKALSQRRVNSVVTMLKARGIKSDRITTKAFGEDNAPQGEVSDAELQALRNVTSYMFYTDEE